MKDPIRVTTFTRFLRKIRRRLSRNEWVVSLLGLSRSDGGAIERGLILVQIDGLSQQQLEKALASENMPFLNSLMQTEHYQNHTLYSGLPSSTPGVQGELHYGVKTVVPAFGFRDHRSGHLVRMFANDIAQEVEQKMQKQGPGLLQGGSSYCNIYSGGAEEVHFCATSFGWSEFFRTVNPFKLLLVILFNFVMFLRVAGMMIIEFFRAIIDFFRGILSGRQFWQELIMIPARVAVVVLLRELVTVGACYDSVRGLPIIHLNLLGYDEQAHRRGPSSKFAHWTLRGIDGAIRRIWKSAHRAAGREYDLWVMSDHGQEATRPYQLEHGKLIQKVVADMVDAYHSEPQPVSKSKLERLPSRADWLGIGWLVSVLFGEQDHDIQTRSPHVQTVTSGPIAFVYLLGNEGKRNSSELATRLVNEAFVPMVARPLNDDAAQVITAEGTFVLPQDAILVFGADHPFLEDITEDLIRLVHHPDSGDLVIIGWRPGSQSMCFGLQNGAHAGPGIEETRAFALLPPDIYFPSSHKRYLRPDDLRRAALRFLERDPEPKPPRTVVAAPDGRIRIMTYNVHACVGMDGELSPERIARVIAQSGANIVCLQELDVFRKRSDHRDQVREIANYLEMNHKFHPAWHLEEEKFGNAILTQFPMRVVETKGLHHHKADRSRRSALWAEIDVNDALTVQVINTHLSIYPKEQLIQAKELLEEWVQPASLLGPVVLCGDFNAGPMSPVHKAFSKQLFDVESFDGKPTNSTYFSPFPVTRLDHIFVTNEWRAVNPQVIDSRMARIASDHLPLLVDLKPKTDSAVFRS